MIFTRQAYKDNKNSMVKKENISFYHKIRSGGFCYYGDITDNDAYNKKEGR